MNRALAYGLTCSAAAIVLAVSARSFAGLQVSEPVSVDRSSQDALGGFGSARNSADHVAYLQCQTRAGDSYTEVECVAEDSSGTFAYCWSEKPTYIQAVASITSDATIEFDWDPKTFECTFLSVTTSSMLEPKR